MVGYADRSEKISKTRRHHTMSIKEKLVNSALKEFKSIEELEGAVASNDKCICDLYRKYEELDAKYNQLRSAIVGL